MNPMVQMSIHSVASLHSSPCSWAVLAFLTALLFACDEESGTGTVHGAGEKGCGDSRRRWKVLVDLRLDHLRTEFRHASG